MPEKDEPYNDEKWQAREFRIYAGEEIARIERYVRRLDGDIVNAANNIFKDASTCALLIARTQRGANSDAAISTTAQQLRDAPAEVGELRGFKLFGAGEHTRRMANDLATLLERRADAEVTMARYGEMIAKAATLERGVSAREKTKGIEELRHQRSYADETRKVRLGRSLERTDDDSGPGGIPGPGGGP